MNQQTFALTPDPFVDVQRQGQTAARRTRKQRELPPVVVLGAERDARRRPPAEDIGMRWAAAWYEGVQSYRRRKGHVAA